MKKQIFTLVMALVLATGTALVAQSNTGTQTLPPSQQVDQSGLPESGTGPDVDVDTGANAEDGVMDVEVSNEADPDTAAQGNDNPTGTATGLTTGTATGTTTGTTGTTGTTTGTVTGTTGTTGTMGTTTGTTTGTATGTATGSVGTGLTGTTAETDVDVDADVDVNTDTATADVDAAADTDTALPETASDSPLFALIGLLALAGAAAVRVIR